MHLSIVTGNIGKYEQIARELPDFVITEQVSLDIPEIQTNLLTEISADKCLQAFAYLEKPCLVDDSGIYFHAYHEFPGALSKFLYQGIGLAGIQKMYTGIDDRSAVFQCVLSYMDESLEEPLQFIGEVEGTLSFDRLGKREEDAHLPYDLIFIPEGFTEPALFEWERWLQQSHRVKAVKEFSDLLQKYVIESLTPNLSL